MTAEFSATRFGAVRYTTGSVKVIPGTALTYLAARADGASVVGVTVVGVGVEVVGESVVVVGATLTGRGCRIEKQTEPTRSKLEKDVNGTPITLFVPSVQLVMDQAEAQVVPYASATKFIVVATCPAIVVFRLSFFQTYATV